MRDEVAGNGRGNLILVALVGGLIALAAFAARADAYIYWATQDETGAGSIGRVNLDGTGATPGFISDLQDPCGVAVDTQHIYWANRGTNSIGRANLDGSGVDRDFISNAGDVGVPCGPAVNGSQIWWANQVGGGGQGAISRANLDGSAVQSTFFNSPGSAADPISVGLSGNHVFWSNAHINSPAPRIGTVGRAGIDGTPPPDLDFISLGPNFAPVWVATSASEVYFSNSVGLFAAFGIARADQQTGDIAEVNRADGTGGVAVLGQTLYWANGVEGTVSRSALDGSSPEFAYIRGLGTPAGLAADANTPSNAFSLGALKRNKRRGTAALTVVLPAAGAVKLAGKYVKGASTQGGPGEVVLSIAAKGKAKRKVRSKGKVKVAAEVTFAPTGGTPATKSTNVKLLVK